MMKTSSKVMSATEGRILLRARFNDVFLGYFLDYFPEIKSQKSKVVLKLALLKF